MALFTKDTIDRVRDAVDMVHLVGEKTDLRRVGTRWTGLCPFHDERTPSFSVNAEEKLYYCFGCGEGGDAFKFVQQTEALEFQEAVELLAERFHVRVEREEDDPAAETRGVPIEAVILPAVAGVACLGAIRLVPVGLWLAPASGSTRSSTGPRAFTPRTCATRARPPPRVSIWPPADSQRKCWPNSEWATRQVPGTA